MATSFANLLYLGSHADIDPNGTEGNSTAENASDLLNSPFAGGPMKIVNLQFNDANSDGFVEEDDSGAAAMTGDTITYDVGSGSTTQVLDSHVWYRADVTLSDGSTLSNVNVTLLQMQNGDVFVTDFSSNTLDGRAIADIELTGVVNQFFGSVSGPPQSLVGTTVVCFAPGSMIATPAGRRAVETLRVGDLVWTLDRGYQPILRVHVTERRVAGQHAPIRFAPGSIGPGFPERELSVSPQHRILCRSRLVGRMFDVDEVLLPAMRLLGLPGVSQACGAAPVRYIHLELAQHGILCADGALVESCLRGQQMSKTLPRVLKESLAPLHHADACRLIPDGRRQKQLVARMRKNGVAACEPRPAMVAIGAG